MTSMGFHTDIAIGGHNGSDTSLFASKQVERYHSFAPVVLVLKIIMGQQYLDEPFTGGLGSYKLYVLVAHHIQQHLLRGGKDLASEVLVSFFYRYAQISSPNVPEYYRTKLSRDERLTVFGGTVEVDFNNVMQMGSIIKLFQSCWSRFWKWLQSTSSKTTLKSFLPEIVDCMHLGEKRSQAQSLATLAVSQVSPKLQATKRPFHKSESIVSEFDDRKSRKKKKTNVIGDINRT